MFTPKNNKVQITFQDDNTENKTSNYNSEAQTNKIIKNENKEKSTKNTKDKNHSSDNRRQISSKNYFNLEMTESLSYQR